MTSAMAQPVRDEVMDTALLQRDDLSYSFTTMTLDSADGQRHYQLWIGRPRQPAPASGYPVLWMLDGNAALAALDAELLERLATGQAPVLVGVGYQTPYRFDFTARTYDYTPLPQGEAGRIDELTGRRIGGANEFLDLLMGPMRSLIESQLPVDERRQAIWGHSYGGLVVLHTLFTRPQAFSDYFAASPSLWWEKGFILDESRQLESKIGDQHKRLLIMRGTHEASRANRPAMDDPQLSIRALEKTLAEIPNLHVDFKEFEGMQHGPMLLASLRYVLSELYLQK